MAAQGEPSVDARKLCVTISQDEEGDLELGHTPDDHDEALFQDPETATIQNVSVDCLSDDSCSDSEPTFEAAAYIDQLRAEIKLPSQVCVDFASDSETDQSDKEDNGESEIDCKESWNSYESDLDMIIRGASPLKGKTTTPSLKRQARCIAWAPTCVVSVGKSSRSWRSNTIPVTLMHSVQVACLLKVNAFLEMYSNGQKLNFDTKTILSVQGKRKISKIDSDPRIRYGSSLHSVVLKTGLPLPPYVIGSLNYLYANSLNEQGLFRRAGSAKRVHQFQADCEDNPYELTFEGLTAHDIADSVKHFFRDLPERIFNARITRIVTNLVSFIPEELTLPALQSALQLLPDACREAAYVLCTFLKVVSEHSATNSMTIQNLCVCWTPTLFSIGARYDKDSSSTVGSPSPKKTKQGSRRGLTKEPSDYHVTQRALELMITNVEEVFYPPAELLLPDMSKLAKPFETECASVRDMGVDTNGTPNFMHFIKACVDATLKEHLSGYKNWTPMSGVQDVSYKKVSDDFPLRLWRMSTDVPATAGRVVYRITRERHLWDDDLLQERVVETISDFVDTYEFVQRSIFGTGRRSFVCLRSQHAMDGVHLITMNSVQQPGVLSRRDGVVPALDLATRFIIEPFGSTCRLTVITRQDIRGYSQQLYKLGLGAFLASCAYRIRDSFQLQP
ncbi:rho GTPase-activating protein 7-like isoform X2 [Sycon ciliatum]|uniref:rho GTPase-activating protein 7-like isoform X2 n=1 Tax=Sycon ciliatum TaxID=27933 RepID=UPI0031F60CD0